MQRIEGCITSTAVDTKTIISQIQENNSLGLTNVSDMEEFRERAPIAIVGGGPSLKNTINELREYKNVMACGSVHDYIITEGVNPKWCVVCDPDSLVLNYMKLLSDDTKYLLASQCHPSVFEAFKKYKDRYGTTYYPPEHYIWHAGGDGFDPSSFGENQVILGGGCTVGTRAIAMAIAFGYHNIHLFGFDSCLDSSYNHHAYSFDNPEIETVGNITEIRLGGPESPIFRVAGYMLGQIFDFKKILEVYGNTTRFTVHGDGALKYIMDYGKKQHLATKETK